MLALIADVLAPNADAVAQYRAGKTATFGFLVGQVMKAAAGKANPKRVNELLQASARGRTERGQDEAVRVRMSRAILRSHFRMHDADSAAVGAQAA